MELLVLIIVISFILGMLYITFKPRLDVVKQPKRKVVLLWYNLYIDGRIEAKRAYKCLFTIKQL